MYHHPLLPRWHSENSAFCLVLFKGKEGIGFCFVAATPDENININKINKLYLIGFIEYFISI